MRIKLLIFTFFLPFLLFAQSKNSKLNVSFTGTYIYSGKAVKKDGEIHGYFGEIRIKEISKGKIAMAFYISKGAPGYNSGSFVDTLLIKESQAIYKTECDSNCTILFKFSRKGVTVSHNDADGDYNFSCCFGHSVIAHGYFKKTSSKVPIIKDLLIE